MLHSDKSEFIKVLERTSAQTGFPLFLLEKDYYISLLLSGISDLNENLIFKGGTCLNKIYYSYYRLSEDIDFSLKLPNNKPTRTTRRNAIGPIKSSILPFVKQYNLTMERTEKSGHNESSQYRYFIDYDSVVIGRKQSVKIEISLRHNPVLPTENRKINHKFLHPFTQEPLFAGGSIRCLSLKELVAEKLRAAATRQIIAPRDYYDLGYLLKTDFDFKSGEFLDLFRTKLNEDGFNSDLKTYHLNLGRSESEINNMKSRIKSELLDVLTPQEKKTFNLQETLEALNKIFRAF